jgi:hypothetical protein
MGGFGNGRIRDQAAWLEKNCQIRLVLTASPPAGQIRFNRSGLGPDLPYDLPRHRAQPHPVAITLRPAGQRQPVAVGQVGALFAVGQG